MPTTNTHITTEARRLARQHNNDQRLVSGYIYEVCLRTGRIHPVVQATYACEQRKPGDPWYGRYAYLRVGHGRLSYADAARFLADKGVEW